MGSFDLNVPFIGHTQKFEPKRQIETIFFENSSPGCIVKLKQRSKCSPLNARIGQNKLKPFFLSVYIIFYPFKQRDYPTSIKLKSIITQVSFLT